MVRDSGVSESLGLEDGAISEKVVEGESRVFSSGTATCSLCVLETVDDDLHSKSKADFGLRRLESSRL